MVESLNKKPKKTLAWENLVEILNGDTEKILALYCRFWQPIEYYNLTSKFTHGIWNNGIFLNILRIQGTSLILIFGLNLIGVGKIDRKLHTM